MSTMINSDNIYVWDNFFPKEVFNDIVKKSEYVPWKYCEVVSESVGLTQEHLVERFMTWNIYEEGQIHFDPMNLMPVVDEHSRKNILDKCPSAKVHDIKRFRFNGTMKGEGYTMWPHADIHGDQETVWTIVVYLKGDGGTSFYDKKGGTKIKTVDFAPNRAVMFPSMMWHNAESPTQTYFRTSLGIVFMIDSMSNLHIK